MGKKKKKREGVGRPRRGPLFWIDCVNINSGQVWGAAIWSVVLMQLWAQSDPSHPAERITGAGMRIYGWEFGLRPCGRPAASLIQLRGNKVSLGLKPVGAAASGGLHCVYRDNGTALLVGWQEKSPLRNNHTFCGIVFESDTWLILHRKLTRRAAVNDSFIQSLSPLR